MTPESDPRRVRRVARVLVSDIVTYRAEDLRLGIEKDDLFERFDSELLRARGYFRQRVDASFSERERERIFDHAIVDVMVYGARRIPSWIW